MPYAGQHASDRHNLRAKYSICTLSIMITNLIVQHRTQRKHILYSSEDLTHGRSSFFKPYSTAAQENDSGTRVKFESQIVSKHESLFSTKGITREGLDFMVSGN